MYIIRDNSYYDTETKDYLFSRIFNMVSDKDLVNYALPWYEENYDTISVDNIKKIYEMMQIPNLEFYHYLNKVFNEIGCNPLTDTIDLEFIFKNLERCYIARLLVFDINNAERIVNYLKFLKESIDDLPNNLVKVKNSSLWF